MFAFRQGTSSGNLAIVSESRMVKQGKGSVFLDHVHDTQTALPVKK